jgi:uncharacterized protein DUF4410
MNYAMRQHALLLIGSLSLMGCTGTTVKPNMMHRDESKAYTSIAVGEIAAPDELWHNYAIEVHRELASQLLADRAFAQVLDPSPAQLPIEAVLISGNITEADKGSAAARWIVGFGAGRAHITAEFRLTDSVGTQIGTYSVRKTYAGGAGIGGAGFLDMDDLAKKLGAAAAESLDSWQKTGKFEEQ